MSQLATQIFQALTPRSASREGATAAAALAAAGLGAWELDLESKTLTASALCRTHFGHGADAHFSEREFIAAIHPDDLRRYRDAFEAALQGAEIDGEFRIRWPGGEVHWIEMRGRAVADAGQAPTRIAGVTSDVTLTRFARDHLDEMVHLGRQSELGQMAAGLAHELNQPLAAAHNYLSAALRMLTQNMASDRIAETIGKADAQLLRTGDVIRHIRSLAGRPESLHVAEDVAAIIEDPVRLMLHTSKSDTQLEFTVAPGLPKVLADRMQIEQVMLNLARNALEAMQASAVRRLSVNARVVHGKVEISVADTGPGLTPEVAAHLFQPFITTKPNGTGVGLSLCRAIVEAHGGEIRHRPAADGGAVFSFTLPLA